MLEFKTLSDMGMFGTNCYIVPTKDKRAVIIDAPCQPKYILEALENMGLELCAILLTHGHCDHIEAVNELVRRTNCKVYIHEDDEEMLKSSTLCLADYFRTPFNEISDAITFSDGDVIDIDGLSFKVISTPGHTKGSVCYLIDNVIFSGDTLFYGSIGRTDFPNGSFKKIIESISKLMALDKNYSVYPGHGEPTDLHYELKTNPFLESLR